MERDLRVYNLATDTGHDQGRDTTFEVGGG